MGGGGKGGSNKSSDDLNEIAKQFFDETSPLRTELNTQFLEALNTGGSGARMPIIAKSQERSRQATSNALQALDTNLAQSGTAGTPFGDRLRTETTQKGEQATAQVPTNIVMQMLQAIPGYVTGANQTTVTGLGQAAGAEASSQGAAGGMLGAMLSPFSFNFGS
jgi:hypothetical protein